MSKKELTEIYRKTLREAPAYGGSYQDSTLMTEDEVPQWSEITAVGMEEYNRGPPQWDERPVVRVVNGDTLDVAMDLECSDGEVLVLNMASDHTPGGGVAGGASAQEEEIFRRTDYCNRANKAFYPLKGNNFVGTEGVTIFKDSNYKQIDDTRAFDFIAMPAVRRPVLDYEDDGTESYQNPEDEATMRERISLIFRFAVLENKTHLVLGALGCGAFGNPPHRVAEMFREAISMYGSYFKEIVFAVLVLDDGKGSSAKSSGRNYETFKQYFP